MGITSRFGPVTGEPVIDRATCSACGTCALACSTGVLTKGEREVAVDREAGFGCIACGHCMMVCPTGSITVTGRGIAPGDVVDLPPAGERATPAQLEALLLARRSMRRFKTDPVPRDLLERVVAAAALAPMGIPPWEVGVVVFDTRAKVRALSDLGVAQYAGLLKMMDNRVVGAAMGLMKKATRDWFRTFLLPLARGIVEGRRQGRDHLLYDAPACLLFHAGPQADAADTAIACTAAMLQAEAFGLGTCMIGALPGPLARSKAASAKAGCPAGQVPKIALLVGWPALKYRKGIRRSFSSVAWRDA